MSLAGELKDISSKPNESKYGLYESVANRVVTAQDATAIVQIVKHLVMVEGAEQYGRTYIVPDLLGHILHLLADPEGKNEDSMDVEDLTPLMKQLVDLIRPKAEDVPDALMNALDLLAKCHQANGDYKSAAYTLSSFKFDDFKSDGRLEQNKCSANAERRALWFVQTAEFFLAIGESGLASQQIKRAHALMSELSKQQSASASSGGSGSSSGSARSVSLLILRFKTCYARILDSERKFLEASLRYMELSQSSFDTVSDSDRSQSLEYAISCGILAKAGPARSRVLAMLCSDERSRSLQNFAMLEKMFKERIISAAEVSAFEKMLQPHQIAETGTKRTVLQNSVIEHNLLAASKIYQNIRFDQLGFLLGIRPAEAEHLAGSMIEQGRLKGSIDQVESLIEFHSGGDELDSWDEGIGSVCMAVNKVLDEINRKYPGGAYEV